MNRFNFFPILLAGALVTGVLPARAGHDEEESNPQFRQMDTDGDGRLSRTEHADGCRALFAAMDSNQDGFLTVDEIHARDAERTVSGNRAFGQADGASHAVGSGAARADGSVSSHEVANARTATPAVSSAATRVRGIDRDGDGRLSPAEHAARAALAFTRMDVDRDGTLTPAECQGSPELAGK